MASINKYSQFPEQPLLKSSSKVSIYLKYHLKTLVKEQVLLGKYFKLHIVQQGAGDINLNYRLKSSSLAVFVTWEMM